MLLSLILVNVAAVAHVEASIEQAAAPQLIALRPRAQFPEPGKKITLTYNEIRPTSSFKEVIPSWNVKNSAGAQMKFEIRCHTARGKSAWYSMADWSLDAAGKRASLNGQSDADASVFTDTVRMKDVGYAVDVRITLERTETDTAEAPTLSLVTLSFASEPEAEVEVSKSSTVWGKELQVPQRAQGNYPRGSVLCSPTSLSMLLWKYSEETGQPEMNQDVPEVEAKVWDPVYDGAGNWSFNCAYAGSFSGMRSYVARFSRIPDLERWIEAGLPVICSVSFDLVNGRPLSPTESGHLLVLIGFEADGDPIFNDPARRDQVRYVYKREDFDRAWRYSKRTVYVVHPESATPPKPSNGLWITQSLR